jgi:DNA mismatch repair protein MutS
MSELKCIMKNADESSIVLGDELCSGTETVSASALVAAGIVTLAKRHVNFIFATHLHFLSTNDKLKQLDNVKNYHMSVIFDDANNRLIYNRILKEGSGPSTYGIEVCRSMHMDPEFMELASEFRREMSGSSKYLYDGRESKYNTNKMVDLCEVCKKPAEDTHHIDFQCNADINGMIGHRHKNVESNLVAVCKKCHEEVHHGNLEIKGYIATSEGIVLNYKRKHDKKQEIRKSRKKLSEQDVKIVKKYLQNYNNLSRRLLREKINQNENIVVSERIIGKIAHGVY